MGPAGRLRQCSSSDLKRRTAIQENARAAIRFEEGTSVTHGYTFLEKQVLHSPL